jgi:hypothetical protein
VGVLCWTGLPVKAAAEAATVARRNAVFILCDVLVSCE